MPRRESRHFFDVKHAVKLKKESECVQYLERVRWPDRYALCPRCDNDDYSYGGDVKEIKTLARHVSPRCLYLCNECRLQFTVTSHTIFHRTHVPLKKWFAAIHTVFARPEITVKELQRKLDTTYKTADHIKGVILNIAEYGKGPYEGVELRHPETPTEQRRWVHREAFDFFLTKKKSSKRPKVG